MAPKDRARGKALELTVGRMLGGRRRRAGEGIEYDDCVDIFGQPLPVSIEAKAYSQLQLRGDWIEQAQRNSGGRPWYVVQRPKGSRIIYATSDFEWQVELLKRAGVIA